jgi:hypothetical protein
METSVFKAILDYSLTGKKIYGGIIEWLDGLETHSLIVRSAGGYAGLGSIDGAGFSIGNNVPINFIGAVNTNFNSVTTGNILLSGDMTFSENSLNDFYSNYVGTKAIVDGMVTNNIDTITSFVTAQLINLVAPSTISSTKWHYLSTMQDVESGANVIFGSVSCGAITAATLDINSTFITAVNAVVTGKSFLVYGSSAYGLAADGKLKADITEIKSLSVYSDTAKITSNGAITGRSLNVTHNIDGVDIGASGLVSATNGFKTTTSTSFNAGNASAGTLHFTPPTPVRINTTACIDTNASIQLTALSLDSSIVTVGLTTVANNYFDVKASAECWIHWLIINKKT